MPPFVLLKKLLQLRNRGRAKYEKEKATANPSDQTLTSKDLNITIPHINSVLVKYKNTECVCRICLQKAHSSIFGENETENIAENIREHARIELSENDNFPNFICESCLALLEAAILFRNTAQISDQKLRESTISSDKRLPETNYIDNYVVNEDDKRTSTPDSEFSEKLDTIENSDFIFSCKKCNMNFQNHMEFLEHRRSSRHRSARAACPECGVTVSSFYLATHVRRRHTRERPYVCEVCGKSFAVLGAYKKHASVHGTSLTFACPECPYRGRFAESLRAHRRVHGGERAHACHACPARFLTRSNLNKHARSHLTDFAFKCGECNKGFHTTREMTEHQKVQHSGVREHLCYICGKEFGYRKAMMKHQRKVHHTAKRRSGRMPLYLQLEENLSQADTMQQNQTDGT